MDGELLTGYSEALARDPESDKTITRWRARTQAALVKAGQSAVRPQEEVINDETRKERRRDIDRRIASHPNAWSRGRLVPTGQGTHELPKQPPKLKGIESPSERPKDPLHPQRPGEGWAYRRRTRRVYRYPNEPYPPKGCPGSGKPTTERQAIGPDFSRPRHGVRQPSPPPQRSQSKPFRFNEEPPYHHRRNVSSTSSSDEAHQTQHDEVQSSPHVKFAPGTKNESNKFPSRPAERSRATAAIRDDIQEDRDQKEMDDRKRTVRHKLHKGGGAFELDGHYSEDIDECAVVVAPFEEFARNKTGNSDGPNRQIQGAFSDIGLQEVTYNGITRGSNLDFRCASGTPYTQRQRHNDRTGKSNDFSRTTRSESSEPWLPRLPISPAGSSSSRAGNIHELSSSVSHPSASTNATELSDDIFHSLSNSSVDTPKTSPAEEHARHVCSCSLRPSNDADWKANAIGGQLQKPVSVYSLVADRRSMFEQKSAKLPSTRRV